MKIQKLALFIFSILLMGCADNETDKPFDCSTVSLSVQLVSQTNLTGCSASDGSVEVSVEGGTAPYTYRINGGSFTTSPVFQNLTSGTYTIEVSDVNGCISTLSPSATISNPNSNLSATISNSESDTGCLTDNGTLTVIATGGEPPYLYNRVGTAFTGNATFSNLASGNYTITVKDNAGCVFSVNKTVSRGDTGVSWAAEVKSIIDTKCAISTCHNGSQFPDLRELSNVQNNKAQIRSLTQNGTMPRNGSLTSEQKAKIACWVDDGAKNN